MKTYKIPKEESAYVCLPITKNGGAVDTSALTGISMKLKSGYGTETTLTVEALGYSGVVAKIENVACGSYTLKATGTDTASAILTAECMLEVVHYDSQANVVAGVYKTLPCYILTNEKEGVGQKGLEVRMASLESSMANVTALASAQVPSRLSTLETGLTAANTAIATKATVVDLADVISCACTDAQNTGICDHCKLPTLKATFIYSVDSNTVLIPHMRTIKVTGKRGYADGYYLAFCVYHNTQSDPQSMLYLLFNMSTKKLVGKYSNEYEITVPEWVLYAFHEINGIGSEGYIIDITDDGVATDIVGRKWQFNKYVDRALDPLITITDITNSSANGKTGAVYSISIDYDTATERYYKIEKIETYDNATSPADTTINTQKAYSGAITFAGHGKYKITAWSVSNGQQSEYKTKEFSCRKCVVDNGGIRYNNPEVTLKYNNGANIPASPESPATVISLAPTYKVEQTTVYTYTDGSTSSPKTDVTSSAGLSFVVVGAPNTRVTKDAAFASNGKFTCSAATTYSVETVIKVTLSATVNNKSNSTTVEVKQNAKIKVVYFGSSTQEDASYPTTAAAILAGTPITSGTVKDFYEPNQVNLVWIAVSSEKPEGAEYERNLKIKSETMGKEITGDYSQTEFIEAAGLSYKVFYAEGITRDKLTITFD